MEIVLQWLDEIDDLVFAGLSFWRRLRRCCLFVAWSAALGLHVLPPLGIAAADLFALLYVSIAALLVWTIFAALTASADQSRFSPAGDA